MLRVLACGAIIISLYIIVITLYYHYILLSHYLSLYQLTNGCRLQQGGCYELHTWCSQTAPGTWLQGTRPTTMGSGCEMVRNVTASVRVSHRYEWEIGMAHVGICRGQHNVNSTFLFSIRDKAQARYQLRIACEILFNSASTSTYTRVWC